MTLLLLSLFSLASAAGAAPPALERELAEMTAKGFEQEKAVRQKVGETTFTAVIFRHADKDWRKLNVYAQIKDKAFLVFSHPGGISERLEFDPVMSGDRFPDLLRNGSFCILYHATVPGLDKRTLYVLRCAGPRVRLAGQFPEGEFKKIAGSDRRMIIAKTLPLGRFFSAGCDNFSTMSKTAFQTRIFAAQNGRFADVSAEHPAFYDTDIARLEDAQALIPKEKNPGDFLGAAVSIYFDYAAKGERRRGWQRLGELIKPPPPPIPGVAECLEQVKDDIRRKLDIPEDW